MKKSGERQNKMEMKWEEGIWLGHETMTNEVVIGTPNGCVKAWAVKRRIEEERWDMKKVNAVRGTPAEPVPGSGSARVPIRVRLGEEETSRDDGAEVDVGDDEEREPRTKQK